MARFRMVGERGLANRKLEVLPNGTVKMNQKGTKFVYIGCAEVEIFSPECLLVKKYISTRDSIQVPNGAQVLPYFKKGGKWYVVMVEQFRIALPGQTTEAPGGEVHSEDIQASMAQELEEETRIKINAQRIEVVLSEFALPSLVNCRMYGGIVELVESEIPQGVLAGEHQSGSEYTILAVKPLVEMLRFRDSQNHDLDLWGSRLLDEVAKKVGLLQRNY